MESLIQKFIDLGQEPWTLWCDRQARWQNDALHLPGEFSLETLPLNAPSIGWKNMYAGKGIEGDVKEVRLPATVEEHFWGEYSSRSYGRDEYFFAQDDPETKNGNYRGVSWWWREVRIPKEWAGNRMRLDIPGARLRAEVYLNERLVGYDIISETPFTADVTSAAQCGAANRLAIRITNPGGRLDWPDFELPEQGVSSLRWGSHALPLSHGFGGLDDGIKLEAVDPIHTADIFIKNKPNVTDITLEITVSSLLPRETKGRLSITIAERENPEKSVWEHVAQGVSFKPGEQLFVYPAAVPSARLWELEDPHLYTVMVRLDAEGENVHHLRRQDFGFRWFEVRGLGSNAAFYLNGRRIVLRSAISWGYWPLNGLFPTEEFAAKEVRAAKELGLNMLSFHRNIGKTRVLDRQDREGLLRWEEPGGGRFSWSPNDFARKYEREKIRRMILSHRNHPSLIIYCLQNEQVKEPPDDPLLRQTMEMVHRLDPTRLVVLKSAWSGTPPEKYGPAFGGGQAYFLPYDFTCYKDDGTGWCGWYDQHTVGGPGIWRHELYKGPHDFSHRTDIRDQIVYWGEVLGVGTPDNLGAIHGYYRENKDARGYDRCDHLDLYTACDRFLDERGFREAFPTVNSLTLSIGNKSYYFWGRMVENLRICNPNDGLAISGWESTSIENHSGLVDVFRNLKGDPQLVSFYTRPLHLAVKSRRTVLETGAALATDLYIVNEKDLQGAGNLKLRVLGPEGALLHDEDWTVELKGGDIFGQLLVEGLETACYRNPGYYILEASLAVGGETRATGREKIFVVDWASVELSSKGAVLESDGFLGSFLKEHKDLDLPAYSTKLKILDYVILGCKSPRSIDFDTEILDRVWREGTGLVLLANDRQVALAWAKGLAEKGVIEQRGTVGAARASWMGSWYFVKAHPLFQSLPVNTALSWEYQTDVQGTAGPAGDAKALGADGLLLDGGNVEYVAAYGRDHDRRIGAGVAVIGHGKGKIILSCLPGLYEALDSDNAIVCPTARRLLCNFIRHACG
jgi:beta-galactosidase